MTSEVISYFEYSPYFPNPVTCMREYSSFFARELNNRYRHNYTRNGFPFAVLPWDGITPWLKQTWEQNYIFFYLEQMDVINIVFMALFLTVLRIFLNFAIFKRLPRWLQLCEQDAEKFPESMWKFSLYSVTWTWAVYICLFSESQYFHNLRSHWDSFVVGREMKPVEYWLYILQLGFYTHCVYASVFIETIRKDFAVLMVHHFLTLGLLGYSLAVRFHPVGILVLFVHDIGDVCLEGAKTVLYCKVRNGVEHSFPERAANVLFAVFTIEWILFRLYWFLTKVLYSTGVVCAGVYPNGPLYLPFNLMLLFLYGIQLYWFGFIVKLLVRMALGQSKIEDNREYKEE